MSTNQIYLGIQTPLDTCKATRRGKPQPMLMVAIANLTPGKYRVVVREPDCAVELLQGDFCLD